MTSASLFGWCEKPNASSTAAIEKGATSATGTRYDLEQEEAKVAVANIVDLVVKNWQDPMKQESQSSQPANLEIARTSLF